MDILRLRPGEESRLRELRLRSVRDSPDIFGSTEAELRERDAESWTLQLQSMPTFRALENGRDLGLARLAQDEQRLEQGWLISMWVAPEARRVGVGRLLVAAVIAEAQTCGMRLLALDVGDDNAPAIALYESLGFVPTGETGALDPARQHIRIHRRVKRLSTAVNSTRTT